MPRSQETNLVKTAAVETALGELTSGVVKPVQFEAPVETKSMGQALAEGLNLAFKATATFAEGKNKESRRMEEIKQEGEGKQAAGTFITNTVTEAAKLPLSAKDADGKNYNPRRKYMMDAFTKFNDDLSDNDTIHAAYYEAAMSKTGRVLETYAKKWDDVIIENTLADAKRTLGGTIIENIFDEQGTTHDAIQKARDSQRFDSIQDATEFVLKMVAGKLEEDIVSGVLKPLDAKEKIKELLKISSADGVIKNYAADPKYKEIIDGVEATLKSVGTSIHTANNAMRDEARDATRETLRAMLVKGSNVADTKAFLKGNSTGFTTKEYLDEEADIEGFYNTAYSTKGNPEVYNMVRNSISNGTYTPHLLSSNKKNLTIAEYKKLNEEQISYAKAIQDDRVAIARDTFNKMLTVGKGEASQESIFVMTKAAFRRKAVYTVVMLAYRNDFISAEGWSSLTLESVNKWHKEALIQAKGAVDNDTPTENSEGNYIVDGITYDSQGNTITPILNNPDWTLKIK